MGYTKLFSDIVMSTIWREPDHVRLVWVTMLALADRDSTVQASIPGLADAARVTIPQCVEALEKLKSPDEFSRTKDFEGRRIEEIDGGWQLLNGPKYRRKMSVEERREYKAIKQREYRARQRQAADGVDTRGQMLNRLTHTETKAEEHIEEEDKPLQIDLKVASVYATNIHTRGRPSCSRKLAWQAACVCEGLEGDESDHYEYIKKRLTDGTVERAGPWLQVTMRDFCKQHRRNWTTLKREGLPPCPEPGQKANATERKAPD